MSIKLLIVLNISLLMTYACSENNRSIEANNEFFIFIDEYLKYIDSTKSYRENFDYVYLYANKRNDSTDFIITLYGGAFGFLDYSHRNEIKDFLDYKGYKILLIGYFPNEIIRNKLNKNLDIKNDIVKKYYPKDFLKWQQDSSSVGPLLYDYMGIFLTYKKDKLIDYHRQYY